MVKAEASLGTLNRKIIEHMITLSLVTFIIRLCESINFFQKYYLFDLSTIFFFT